MAEAKSKDINQSCKETRDDKVALKLARYPKITDDGKIETYPFLEACRSIISLYDNLGTTLIVVKKDMLGNVEKLSKVYNKSPEKYKYINDMIIHEKEDPKLYAVDALLWLKRALEFIYCFMTNFIVEHQKNSTVESVNDIVEDAYTKVLKRHHNWLVQNFFKVMIKTFPYRSEILNSIKTIYAGNEESMDKIFGVVELYYSELEANLKVINKLYLDLKLETLHS